MSVNDVFWNIGEVDFLGNDLSGLNDIYRDIADEIGIENTLIIYRLFRGTQISFPSSLFSKEHTRKAIVMEYNGKNVPQLAQKYNYSERTIWRILKSNKTK
ncbi:MAG: Mor transcription activator family protein [Clostridia bacterium]|nr:Mor transcription activator family protein [Clostridia bacterium]